MACLYLVKLSTKKTISLPDNFTFNGLSIHIYHCTEDDRDAGRDCAELTTYTGEQVHQMTDPDAQSE